MIVTSNGETVHRTIRITRAPMLWGQVSSLNGEPVAGVSVVARASLTPDRQVRHPLLSLTAVHGTTDAEGRFELLAPVAEGDVELSTDAVGMVAMGSGPQDIEIASMCGTNIILSPAGRLEGRAVDEFGAPLAGVALEFFPHSAEGIDGCDDWEFWRSLGTLTSADGEFVAERIPLSTIDVIARRSDRVCARVADVVIQPRNTARVLISMRPGLTITGRVVRDDGGTTGEVSVQIDPVGGSAEPLPWPVGEVTADSDGRFRVSCLDVGRYRLTVSGAVTGVAEPLVVQAGAADVLIHICAQPGADSAVMGVISGIVRFADGRPVAAALVIAEPTAGSKLGVEVARTVTQTDGSFRLSGLKSSAHDLVISPYTPRIERIDGSSCPNIQSRRIDGVAVGTDDIVIEVEPGLVVSGSVRGHGLPLSTNGQVTVRRLVQNGNDGVPAQRWDVVTSSSVARGRFFVFGLAPGRVLLTFDVAGWARTSLAVDAGAEAVAVDLDPGGTIAGNLLVPDGLAAGGVSVRVLDRGDDSDVLGLAVVKSDGSFRFEGAASGEHRVIATWSFGRGEPRYEGEAWAVVKSGQITSGVTITMALAR